MASEHPSIVDFRSFLKGVSQTASNSLIVQHLLADCSSCRARLHEMGWDGSRLERLIHVSETELNERITGAYSYDAAFARADRALASFFAPVRPMEVAPEELLTELLSLPEKEQARRIASDQRFAAPQLVHHLLDRSHAVRYQDHECMLNLAHLARLVADAVQADAAGGELRLADLRTRAWGHYGNSLRVCGRLREAEEALARAASEREAGTGDPPLKARLLEQLASLQIFQRRFESAIEFADEAGKIYRELGESHLLASSLVHKAIATLYSGETEAAVEVLNHAIPLIDYELDPHLLLAACHNLVRCYIDLDRPEQALSLYSETRDLYREFADPLILLRAGWQEGQLLRDLGHLRNAETSLLNAQKGFVERGLSYEAAVVSLDVAALYVKMGSIEDLKQTAVAAVPIFRALGVDREALASLLQLQHVAGKEQQAMELIRFLNARIEPLAKRNVILK
ncbi:MAG TPA: tetratricopeptide repeat protein [Thermoanaerobaculia bacterium]|nr:tetratricopeptide repeat protein [Thermoanaerobaculia bacterium]